MASYNAFQPGNHDQETGLDSNRLPHYWTILTLHIGDAHSWRWSTSDLERNFGNKSKVSLSFLCRV
jgi:hypothetical protein